MIRIFIAYSSKDLVFKDEIRKRLRPMERAGKVDVWDNYNIEAGKDWDAEVREKLGQSDIILLLLSPDALASDYFYEVEAPIALQRHEAGEAIAVGILLRPCDLKYTPFGDMTRYELLPKKGLPVTDRHWRIFDEAYLTIFQEVDVLVEKIEERRSEEKSDIKQLTKEEEKGKKALQEIPDKKHHDEEVERKKSEGDSPKNGQVLRDIPEGPEMVFVEGGTFQMGSNYKNEEKPIHSINVPSFWMGRCLITWNEYDTFCIQTGKERPSDVGWGRGLRPIINVSWKDAQEYCKWLSDRTGKRYRLATEAEWEYAATGGKLRNGFKYAGSDDLKEVGWYSENSKGETHPVGEKKSNELGLYDMSGNVWEWCQDAWHENFEGAPSDGSAWEKDGKNSHVLRGGAWDSNSLRCAVHRRIHDFPKSRGYYYGFRLVRDV